MNIQKLSFSDSCYRALLRAYPRRFRQRFGQEMGQVFRASMREAYRTGGNAGVFQLWLPTLWDWALTAVREQISSLLGKDLGMTDTLAFDRQLGDAVWMMSMGLLAGYSLEQAFEALSKETAEPSRSVFKQVFDDLQAGKSLDVALANLQKSVPSELLSQVIAIIQKNQKEGGNLGIMLEESIEKLVERGGSDPANYEAMRTLSEQILAPLPIRARPAGEELEIRMTTAEELRAFNRQLGGDAWMMARGLLVGWSLYQAVQGLSLWTPEPSCRVFKKALYDIGLEKEYTAAFTNLQQAIPSRLLSEMVTVILEQQKNSYDLGRLLIALSEKFIQEAGYDPALDACMRQYTEMTRTNLPEWAK